MGAYHARAAHADERARTCPYHVPRRESAPLAAHRHCCAQAAGAELLEERRQREVGQVEHCGFRDRILRSKRHAERAQRLIGTKSTADRKKAYESHREVLAMPAQAARGKPVYQRACAQCHTLGALGHAVGPDLTGLRNQPAEALLLHILDPNREVYATYRLYEVQTHDGDTLAGILTSETPDSVTLVLPLGLRQTLLRSHITQLRASTKSLMPENLETTMTRQELADLLAFMKQ